MNTRQAKDFLADQAAQQAVLDHIPLSDLEKRMMYFTETDPASCAGPIGLKTSSKQNMTLQNQKENVKASPSRLQTLESRKSRRKAPVGRSRFHSRKRRSLRSAVGRTNFICAGSDERSGNQSDQVWQPVLGRLFRLSPWPMIAIFPLGSYNASAFCSLSFSS